MATILGIDASTELCSVALLYDDNIQQLESDIPKAHAEVLLPMVDELLHTKKITLAEVDSIAVSAGPGSFTGLRIAFSTAQGLAYALDKTVHTCSSLQVLANTVSPDSVEQQWLLCVLDARMDELYWAIYQKQNDVWREVVSDQLSSVNELRDKILALGIEKDTCAVTGNGAQSFLEHMTWGTFAAIESYPQASSLVRLAAAGADGVWCGPASQASLSYLRDSVSWNKRKRIRK